MEYVGPGASFSSRLSLGPDQTGLVGTVRFRLLDNDSTADDPVQGPTSAGIIEDPTGSGDYVYAGGVAPTTAGHYARAWDTGPGTRLLYDDDLIVTRTAVNPFAPTGNEYVTREELRIWLELEDDDEGFNVDLDLAVEAASRAVDGYKRRHYYAADRVRYYTAPYGADRIAIHDLATLTELALDFANDGSFSTVWTAGTEFVLNPEGATEDGVPFTELELLRAGRRFPIHDRAIRISGSFGWPNPPANVKQATKILAARLFKRRETPYAILPVVAAEMVQAARLGRIDPDVAYLLENIPGDVHATLSTIRLG